MTRKCQQCGENYTKKPYVSNEQWLVSKFCSRACKNASQRDELPREKTCVVCSTTFSRGPKHGRRDWANRKHCSSECHHADPAWIELQRTLRAKQTNVVVFQSGEKHPNWKGGITELRKAFRNLDRYIQWRTEIFLRDNRQCVQCGSPDEIEADHIVPLTALLKIFEIQTPEEARDCDFLWDLTNGRTLCHTCHSHTETYAANAKKHWAYVLADKITS